MGDDPAEIALRTAEGEPIAASIRTIGTDRVFAPEQPIAEGTQLVLEYSLQCYGEPPPQTLLQTFEFMTSVHSALEFNPGRVRHWPGESNGDTSLLSPMPRHRGCRCEQRRRARAVDAGSGNGGAHRVQLGRCLAWRACRLTA